jgi:outer membrane receptor protein involved in Fe transport
LHHYTVTSPDSPDSDTDGYLAPRLGFGATLFPGHRIRAAHIRDVNLGAMTLSPSTVLGLYPIAVNQDVGARTRANIFRYDGTFANRFHLSLEHQSLRYSNANFGRDLASEDLDSARFDRTELRGEAWIGHGVGAFASMVWLNSEVQNERGASLPGVPDREASLGLNWVHPSRFRASARVRYAGERPGYFRGETLEPVWTVDAAMSWETSDKRMQFSASATNLFDANVQRSFGLGREERSISVNAAIRF